MAVFVCSIIILIQKSSKKNRAAKFLINENIKNENQKVDEITELIVSGDNLDKIRNIVDHNQVDLATLQKCFDNAVNYFLRDNLLSIDEEKRVQEFTNYFNLTQADLNTNGNYEKIVQSSILRAITDGEIPENRINFSDGVIPFSLNKNEKLIWVFQNVNYHEEAIKKSYVGKSSGVSIRVAKGVYYRTSGFKGHPVETQYLKFVGTGLLGFTDKNIYFYSHQKSFKIPYSKIVSTMPYEDGIRLQKDGVSAKPQIFSNISGWFSYNLIMNLNQL